MVMSHDQKVENLANQLKAYKSKEPISFKKKTVPHQVPKPNDKYYSDNKIYIGNLTDIISIDPDKKICIAEPGVTFVDLVKATLKYNLIPLTVPEHKTITIGGAVAGCSIESMSYKYGGFHDSCLEYEVITAKGDVVTCSPQKDNLLFQMMHGTFGTLGIISKLKFKLIDAKPFVKVNYEKYPTLKEYKDAIWRHFKSKDIDFMDGFLDSPKEFILSVGNFVDKAPYTHSYDWTRVYYPSIEKRDEDYLKTINYLFRYDKGHIHSDIRSFIGRLLFGKIGGSNTVLRLANAFHWLIPAKKIPVVVDLFIPFSKIDDFVKWYEKEIGFFPIWCVPYKPSHGYEWLSPQFISKKDDGLVLDIAIYDLKKEEGKNYYRMMEEEIMRIKGIKTLISNNYFSKGEFWKIWNKKNYDKVKKVTDPDNIFRDLYEKTCKASMGFGK